MKTNTSQVMLEKQMLNTHSLSNLHVSDRGVFEKVSIFRKKVNKLNLQTVAKKLMSFESGCPWTAEKTELAISFYKMFLCLHFLFPDVELTPTQEIDKVWHTHILLNTYKYIQDCQELYGYILHHYSPVDEINEFQHQYQEMALAVTKNLFKELFGVSVLGNSEFPAAPCVILPPYLNLSLQRSACLTRPKEGQIVEIDFGKS